MSLTLQNDVARRLGYCGPRQAVIASALFGRSCRLLEPSAIVAGGDVGLRSEAQSGDRA